MRITAPTNKKAVRGEAVRKFDEFANDIGIASVVGSAEVVDEGGDALTVTPNVANAGGSNGVRSFCTS